VDLEGAVQTHPDDPEVATDLMVLTQPPAYRPLRISEVLPENKRGHTDEEGKNEDWLELTNFGTQDVALADYLLTKDFYDPNVTKILPDLVLKPGDYIVLFCDDDVEDGPLHLHFKLDADGDRIFLMKRSPDDSWIWMDEMSFKAVQPDTAVGRPACDQPAVELTEPTPGAPNALPLNP
jgi:hypothetical protein